MQSDQSSQDVFRPQNSLYPTVFRESNGVQFLVKYQQIGQKRSQVNPCQIIGIVKFSEEEVQLVFWSCHLGKEWRVSEGKTSFKQNGAIQTELEKGKKIQLKKNQNVLEVVSKEAQDTRSLLRYYQGINVVEWENSSKTQELSKKSLPFSKSLRVNFPFIYTFQRRKSFEFHLISKQDVQKSIPSDEKFWSQGRSTTFEPNKSQQGKTSRKRRVRKKIVFHHHVKRGRSSHEGKVIFVVYD